MKEIATDVVIETDYEGVTVGAIRTSAGVLMVDAPKRPKDAAAWRAACTRSASGPDRLLVLLDEHPDRVCGASGTRCPVITHERAALAMNNRPSTARQPAGANNPEDETQPETVNNSRTIHPEITFSTSLSINWGEEPILIEYHAGSSKGSTWVILPDRQVAFVGDSVTPKQPPFLASADIEEWLKSLHEIKLARFKDFILISGRATLVTLNDVNDLEKFLKNADNKIKKISPSKGNLDEINAVAEELAREFSPKTKRELELFKNRLVYGVSQYVFNHASNSA